MSHSNDPAQTGTAASNSPPSTDPPVDGGSAPISLQAVPPEPAVSAETQSPETEAPREPWFTPERMAAQGAVLDRLMAGMCVVLAFLLGSFAARNTDFWLHLATGRHLASSGYQFGVDPFAYTT